MEPADVQRAIEAAKSTCSALGLKADAGVVIQNSNRIAVRLSPCDLLARVAPLRHESGAAFEVEIGRRLAELDAPAEKPDPRAEPRVYVRDGFAVTLWTFYEALPSQVVAPAEYAQALHRLHASMRPLDLTTPHFTDRIAEAQRLVADRALTPALDDQGRELLSRTLRGLRRRIIERGAPEQLLHGEPHPGNLLNTTQGLLFVDFETCCRGPVEFDLAHAPEGIGELYPGVNLPLLEECRLLSLAMVTTWRWDRNDQLPEGRYWGIEGLNDIRAELDRYGIDLAG